MSSRLRGSSLGLWAPVVLYMAAIFYMSSVSEPPIPLGTDKSLHGLAYLGLAIVVVRAIAGGLPGPIDAWIATIAMLITVGYGVTDEVHQMFVPGRSAELYDLVADAAGAAAGTVACWAWGIMAQAPKPKPQSPRPEAQGLKPKASSPRRKSQRTTIRAR